MIIDEERLDKLEKTLGVTFKNRSLLQLAITHKSWAVEKKFPEWNERLEFLGDSVLSTIVSEFLYNTYPEKNEGELSKLRSNLISRQQLAKWAKKIFLDKFFLISQAEESSGGRKKVSILANMFEAVLGAIFLDQGLEKCKEFMTRNFLKGSLEIEFTDYKSLLQEIVQKKYKILPEYKIVKETGPDHEKKFDAVVKVKDITAFGEGRTKKEAEQNAAKKALEKISSLKP